VIIFCGTSNTGKLREFQLAARELGSGIELRAADAPPPEEHGRTFEETAIEKALYYGRHLGADATNYVFADDSGLEVDALGGAPGVHSARFAGPNATDARNNALLLERLSGIKDRSARFVCAIALVRNGKLIQTFRGAVEGRIIDLHQGDEPCGAHGFGYDPLFYYEPFGCTFGEADDIKKMSVSHRAQALSAMFAYLKGDQALHSVAPQR
jgi:XTP/dITP diphosphohydrolase